jgi:hypothetical protein
MEIRQTSKPHEGGKMKTRLALLAILATGLLAAGAATAIATPASVLGHNGAKQASGATMGTVSVRYKIAKFVKSGHRLLAKGTAVATYTPQSGTPTTVTKAFTARVSVARRLFSANGPQVICPVLSLQLDELSLNLLGLHVDLSKVVLTITADSEGGILGRLLCSLSNGGTRLATIKNAQNLTKAAHSSGLSSKGIGFAVPARQAQALQPGPCTVLDLVLGPLHLNLLGLIVDLNQVHLQITADPNGGILGSLLCSLTNQPTTAVTT